MSDGQPLFVAIGYDHRQPVSFSVLAHSLIKRSSRPLAIIPLVLPTLPLYRCGLTPFTFSRFLVPHLMRYQGWGLFLDIDMLARADIAELFALADDSKSVMVVKNDLRFEWASLMLFNAARCAQLTPEYVEHANGLHAIQWAPEDEIGALPAEWNHLIGYDRPNPDAKLVHFTQGVPCFPETADSEFAEEWKRDATDCFSSISWRELMGNSVHARPVYERLMARRERMAAQEAASA